jgi:tRNA(Ile2) C34 agmatinyltransferase TiaS
MDKVNAEKALGDLESRITRLEKNLPTCPDCGYLLMGDESGGHPYHLQCYRCGSYWDIVEPTWKFKEGKKLGKKFFGRK